MPSRHRKKSRAYNKNKFEYVCDPNSMKIVVHASSRHGGTIDVVLFVNNKEALVGNYKVSDLDPATMDQKIQTFCKGISLFSEKDIKEYVQEDKVTLALYVRKSLKEVRNKLGRLIWNR